MKKNYKEQDFDLTEKYEMKEYTVEPIDILEDPVAPGWGVFCTGTACTSSSWGIACGN